ncbi:hypothetical protein MUG84_15955 [Paenibacillus sp. KQZ6P-2]|uniref:DUF4363 domain-containing protein n=1 Tax=Paenibacillus mangrovi TaxID=2931978 RepID=A0A9X1WSQ0_9BACL|nr:hypothetical protein [Paenibacillus mangrovi]MCJ8013225.1 hypothetical protein [Paenibacillus mangrovi]
MKGRYRIIFTIIIILLGVGLIYQTYKIGQLRSQIEMVNPTLSSKTIQYGLVKLESEISYQKQHDWKSAEQLIVRTQDVMEGIRVTRIKYWVFLSLE